MHFTISIHDIVACIAKMHKIDDPVDPLQPPDEYQLFVSFSLENYPVSCSTDAQPLTTEPLLLGDVKSDFEVDSKIVSAFESNLGLTKRDIMWR